MTDSNASADRRNVYWNPATHDFQFAPGEGLEPHNQGVVVHVKDGSIPGNLQVFLDANVDRAQCAYDFQWFASNDDLVHFVYGNQGPIFMEDAQPYLNPNGSIDIVCEGDRDIRERIFGSWEDRDAYIATVEADNVHDAGMSGASLDYATTAKQPILVQLLRTAADEAAEHNLPDFSSDLADLADRAIEALGGTLPWKQQ